MMKCVVACLLLLISQAGCAGPGVHAVNISLVDLRSVPHTSPQPGHDPQEESQLFYGEPVRITAHANGWARVEAVEQQEFTHHGRWEGYPGWVPDSALIKGETWGPISIVTTEPWVTLWRSGMLIDSTTLRVPMGTRLSGKLIGGELWRISLLDGKFAWIRKEEGMPLAPLGRLPTEIKRNYVVFNAQKWLGAPYLWGGRSPDGVDCSGLTNVLYRTIAMQIPRDAHEQFLRAARVPSPQPGDLVFLSERDNPHKIVHVMLYAGDGDVIEAPGTGGVVRRISLDQRLAAADRQVVSYGSYLP